jgi:hypothetical protein
MKEYKCLVSLAVSILRRWYIVKNTATQFNHVSEYKVSWNRLTIYAINLHALKNKNYDHEKTEQKDGTCFLSQTLHWMWQRLTTVLFNINAPDCLISRKSDMLGTSVYSTSKISVVASLDLLSISVGMTSRSAHSASLEYILTVISTHMILRVHSHTIFYSYRPGNYLWLFTVNSTMHKKYHLVFE